MNEAVTDAAVSVTIDGETLEIRFDNLNAIDAKDFRREVGVSLSEAIGGNSADLDVIAGLVWLSRRKRDPRLRFVDVAKTLNYTNIDIEVPDSDAAADTAAGDADPET